MSQTGDITCPECNTPHLTDDPFCENCGYRLGRPETAFEGYQAIPKELARRAAQKSKGEASASEKGAAPRRPTTQPEQVAAGKAGGQTEVEGHPAIKPLEYARTMREHPPLEPGTLVEGLSPVEKREGPDLSVAARPSKGKKDQPVTERHPSFRPPKSGAAESGATESGAPKSGATESGATESRAPKSGATEASAIGSDPAETEPATTEPAATERAAERKGAERQAAERQAAPDVRTAPRGEPVVVAPSQATTDDSNGSGRTLLAIGWMLSVAIAVGLTLFVTESDENLEEDAESNALPIAPKKVKIPRGTFEAGLDEKVRSLILLSCQKMSPNPGDDCDQDDLLGGEFPVRQVTSGTFQVDHAEVRVGQYRECVRAGVCAEPAWDDCKVYTHQGYQFALRVPKALREDDVPMTCVTRGEASAYCSWAGGRLPSNDEWEWAARGDDGRLFPWGNNWAPGLANWAEADIYRTPVVGELDGFASVAPPGQYEDGKSPHGVFDMAGNVAEWVDGPGDGIARGGAWTSQPFDLRVTGRFELEPTTRRTDVGFRCLYE